MNIKQAYAQMSQKEFVDWALKNKYPYFIKIWGNRESGWIYSKRGDIQYKFDYETN